MIACLIHDRIGTYLLMMERYDMQLFKIFHFIIGLFGLFGVVAASSTQISKIPGESTLDPDHGAWEGSSPGFWQRRSSESWFP